MSLDCGAVSSFRRVCIFLRGEGGGRVGSGLFHPPLLPSFLSSASIASSSYVLEASEQNGKHTGGLVVSRPRALIFSILVFSSFF